MVDYIAAFYENACIYPGMKSETLNLLGIQVYNIYPLVST